MLSPDPVEIVDREPVLVLLHSGWVVVAAGRGGIRVVHGPGGLRGVEAVLDKDLTGSLLATSLGVDCFVIATHVAGVALWFGAERERVLGRIDVDELEELACAGHFASGSMGPKVEAVIRFVRCGGQRAVITSLGGLARAPFEDVGAVVERGSS